MRPHSLLYLCRCKRNLFLNVASSEFQPDCDSADMFTTTTTPYIIYILSCKCVILSTNKGGQINFSVVRSWT